MDFILKPLLHNEELFKLHRQVLKEAMLEAITSNDQDVLESSTILQTLAVESVAKQETSRVLFGTCESTSRALLTRRKEHKFKKIMSNWRQLRMKRLRNEHYLSNTFITDVKRSKIELKFIMKQQKVI
jgi:TRAP-type mannitol/chloroaromatic compound transport system substrate-binding protein